MGELQDLNSQLQEPASAARKESLQAEQVSIENRLQHVCDGLVAKIGELEEADRKWINYYNSIELFSLWLDDREAALNKVHRGSDSPDQQLAQVQVCQVCNT